jgi:peptidoglycan/xylan/chitin deacetylase (PgdA/CDA1 family)
MKTLNLALVVKIAAHVFAASLLGVGLGSCKNADPEPVTEAVAPTKSRPNSSYRAPKPRGPAPRNPDLNLSSSFGADAGVTVSRVSVDQPFVAMTFDDGPHPRNTPRLLDMLRERNIKATFYVIGRNVDMYPELTRRIVAEGHEIGNHTYTHPNLTKLGDESVSRELEKTRTAIANATGVQPRTMRPPYGALRQNQRAWIHSKYRYPTVLWSVDPRDWQRPGPAVVTSRILGASSPGAIILAHDLHAPTVDAMPATLDGLLRRGFRFVTVSQLLAMKAAPAEESAAQAGVDPANP